MVFFFINVLYFLMCFAVYCICDPLSQNEHKVATAAIQNYYRFKFFIMQALKWYMICGYSSLFFPAKINILCWFFFVFYCFVTCWTGYISVCKLATLRSFCGSRSHMWMKNKLCYYVNKTEIWLSWVIRIFKSMQVKKKKSINLLDKYCQLCAKRHDNVR